MPGLLFALLLAVQPPHPPPPPVYRAGVDVVQVDATVLDKHGRFVADLKPEDFQVREDGRPQKIELFYRVGGAATDSGQPSAQFPRIFIAVFDDEHLTPGGFNRVRDAATDLFSREFRPGDIGGVIAGGRMVNDRLSTDRAELLAALHSVRPNAAAASRFAELMAYGSSVNPDGAGEMAGQVAFAEWLDSGTRTSYVLQSLLSKLAPIEGRKIVLLLTEGFPSAHQLTEKTIDLAARANARIYPLDARGLGPATHDVLNELAVETGGVLVEHTNHFQAAVARIAEEAGTYYVLGYRPTEAPDGTFRKISVGVDRADLVVSARRGYVAAVRPSPAQTPTPLAGVATEAAAIQQPGPASQSPAASPDERAAEGVAVPAPRAAPPANAVRLRPDADKNVTALGRDTATDPDASAGWDAYQRGDLETARARLAVAATRPNARPWVLYALGQSDYALAHFDEAVAHWQHVRAGVPDFEPVYFDLVDGYLQRRDYPRAARVLLDAARRWPKDADVFNALGVVDITGGALPDAIDAFDRATKLAPDEPVGYFNLARALEARYVRARTRMRVGVQRTWVIGNADDRKNAIANYQRCVALGGPYVDAARTALKRLGAPTSK